MKRGYLSEHFLGAAAKVLAGTEVDPEVSRGHEYQGVHAFCDFLGTPETKKELPVKYIRLEDDETPLQIELTGTWYNSRKGQAQRHPEYRLYYPASAAPVVYRAKPGDTLFFCMPKTGPLLAISCAANSSIEQQLLWLFDLKVGSANFAHNQHDLRADRGKELSYTARYILELIEIEADVREDEWLERLLKEFGATLPATDRFSAFARRHAPKTDPKSDPDHALSTWIEFEERLFRTLEHHIVSKRIEAGFVQKGRANVDEFIKFSLSVQNRRKARVGFALEHHLSSLFKTNSLRFELGIKTENNNKPDFLFPGASEYRDPTFPSSNLMMLGSKSTCKDRWRQVLSEAKRISPKHLFTLEPSISVNQTSEMKAKRLQLILPRSLHETYKPEQRGWLMDLRDFVALVRTKQS